MDQKQVIAIVREYKKAIGEQYKNACVYLYGSYSKGNANENSDIDVAVILPDVQGNWFSLVPTTLEICTSGKFTYRACSYGSK